VPFILFICSTNFSFFSKNNVKREENNVLVKEQLNALIIY